MSFLDTLFGTTGVNTVANARRDLNTARAVSRLAEGPGGNAFRAERQAQNTLAQGQAQANVADAQMREQQRQRVIGRVGGLIQAGADAGAFLSQRSAGLQDARASASADQQATLATMAPQGTSEATGLGTFQAGPRSGAPSAFFQQAAAARGGSVDTSPAPAVPAQSNPGVHPAPAGPTQSNPGPPAAAAPNDASRAPLAIADTVGAAIPAVGVASDFLKLFFQSRQRSA